MPTRRKNDGTRTEVTLLGGHAWAPATAETATWHNWSFEVRLAAMRHGCAPEKVRAARCRIQAAYRAGEPVWMAACALIDTCQPDRVGPGTFRGAMLGNFRAVFLAPRAS